MTKEIILSQGKVALVDDADYEWLNQWKWSFAGQYAYRQVKSQRTQSGYTTVFMHREILSPPVGMQTDHIDRNKLNNTRANLRAVNQSQNACNVPKTGRNEYQGVSFHKHRKAWQALIRNNGKLIHLGYFENPVDGAKAYDAAARQYHGEFARLNFSDEV